MNSLQCLAPTQSGAAACGSDMRTMLRVNNFQVEVLVINTDNSESKSKQHLAARTINESVIREFTLQTTRRFAGHFLARHLGAVVVAAPLKQSRREMGLKYRADADDKGEKLAGRWGLRSCGVVRAE